MYLSKVGESSPDETGGGSLSYFVSRRMFMINSVNVKTCIKEYNVLKCNKWVVRFY